MTRRRKKLPPPPLEDDFDPRRPVTPEEQAEEDRLLEMAWRVHAWQTGLGRAVCRRAACRRANACAGPTQKGMWRTQQPVCITPENHDAIQRRMLAAFDAELAASGCLVEPPVATFPPLG